MELFCAREDWECALDVLSAGLHALQTYCSVGALLYMACCHPTRKTAGGDERTCWWGKDARGLAGAALGAVWWCAVAAAALRPEQRAALAAAAGALPAWLAATALHAAFERRRAAPALLSLLAYWAPCACAAGARLALTLRAGAGAHHVRVLLDATAAPLAAFIVLVDSLVMYMEISRKGGGNDDDCGKEEPHVAYRHHSAGFYSRVSFFWLRSLLRVGRARALHAGDLGQLPACERAAAHCDRFNGIYQQEMKKQHKTRKRPPLWRCYVRAVWPNFFTGGALKLLGDLAALVPPLGLSAVVLYATETPGSAPAGPVGRLTLSEFLGNGYVMTLLILIASVAQGLLSQNSTHLVYVEGIRLKTALHGLIFDKCLKVASWSEDTPDEQEREPLLAEAAAGGGGRGDGLLTNLVAQDTYNVMSGVWIAHYVWAIPLKITVILYLLYTKLGVSAVIGSAVAILVTTPLQFYIGKKVSDNSKEISNRSDQRIAKISEILQGMKMIKLYVWEDLFKEKILNLREVELKFLNKESFYWGVLTFITHASTIIITVVTFSVYLALEEHERTLTAVNVFAALALVNQLAVPLAVLPVAVFMLIQATVSTRRIENFLMLPEASNTREKSHGKLSRHNKLNTAFIGDPADDSYTSTLDNISEMTEDEPLQSGDYNSDEEEILGDKDSVLVRMKNAVFTWGDEGDNLSTLEVDDLEIPAGKLIMVVGGTASGKSSLLAALLGEMQLERGDVLWSGSCTTAYAGQTAWLMNAHIRENIVLGSAWSPRRYFGVLRAAALQPDLRLLPEGDLSRLGALGVSLSGGQRSRVCVARALYTRARLLVLDEPLAPLDPALARHVLVRGLVPAARRGRTVLVATNRLDVLNYADIVIVMEEGRVACAGPAAAAAARSAWLAAGLRAAARAASEGGAGLRAGDAAGGAARERWMLSRALHRASLKYPADEEPNGATLRGRRGGVHGSHYLAELPAEAWCAAGGWAPCARGAQHPRLRPRMLARQLSSPPAPAAPPMHLPFRQPRQGRALRRAASADTSSAALWRDASVLRRLLRRPTFRWTPRPIRRLLSNKSAVSTDLTGDTGNENAGGDDGVNGLVDSMDLETTLGEVGAELPAAAGAGVWPSDAARTLVEDAADSDVQARVYVAYIRACGAWVPAYCAAALACQVLAVAADCWLARWTAERRERPADSQQMWSWLQGYCWLCCGGALAAAAAQGCAQAAGAAARRRVHDRLLHVVLHLPLWFFDQTPLGRSLNRFSADILVMDKKLASAAQRWSHFALLCVSAVLVNAAVTPWCLLAAAPLAALYTALQRLYSRNARSLQRLDAASSAPLVSLLAEARAGAAVVRAGALQPRLRRQLLQQLDTNHNAFLLLNTTNRWLGVALDLVGACVVSVSLVTALACARAAPALVGLVAAYTLLLPAYLAWVVKFRAELDMCLGALERIQEYTDTPTEDDREDAGAELPADWPSRGEIVLDGVSVRHAPHLPPVLRDVTLTVPPGQKVAVCGRSGGGKSSLVLACAGAAEVCAGALRVDGVDVSRVPLRLLRRRLCVLPQDASLFAGTLRENLDPLAVHTDEELWSSLRAAKLDDFVAAQTAGLECLVRYGGAGWSAGQRARACCARAVLCASRAAALLLDEPGAALDARAEAALLAALAAAAPERTLITVAHRLSAVSEYERILTVEGGRVAEGGGCPGAQHATEPTCARALPPHTPPR